MIRPPRGEPATAPRTPETTDASARLPFEGLRVIDLSRVRSGPTAVRQFADWGADVVMIEPPGEGDGAMPRLGSDARNLHRNKRSLTLDLKQPAGRQVLLHLVETADILIENYRPAVKRRLKIDYQTLSALNPRLIYASISGFGEDGPYADRPGIDQIAQGMGGLMSVTGFPGQGPVRAGIAIADTAAGLYCALGVMTALLERHVTGRGRWVTTSLLQAQIALLDFQAARYLIDGFTPGQEGNLHPTSPAMGLFQTADSQVNIGVLGQEMFERFCRAADVPALIDEARFATAGARARNRGALNAAVAAALRLQPTGHWVETFNDAGVPCGPVYAIDEMFADPQVRHLRMARTLKHDPLATQVVGQAFGLSGLEPHYDTPAPQPGQHTDAILAELGYGDDEVAQLRADAII